MENKRAELVAKNEIAVYERDMESEKERCKQKMCTSEDNVARKMDTSQGNDTCGVCSLDVKSTEVNTEKGLKTRRFRELGVLV